MALAVFFQWDNIGRPWQKAQPIAQLEARARAAGVGVLGTIGNEAHLTDDFPQDHTPFSVTAWPVPLPGWIVCAIDLQDGPWMDRMLADCRSGAVTWIKYMNFRGKNYSVKRNWEPVSSSDQHGHVSIRSDSLGSIGTYNPFIAAPGGASGMELNTTVSGTGDSSGSGDRNVGQILMDLENIRTVLVGGTPNQHTQAAMANWPLMRLLKAIPKLENLPTTGGFTGALNPEQLEQLITEVTTAVINHPDTPLNEDDMPAIEAAVKSALREGSDPDEAPEE